VKGELCAIFPEIFWKKSQAYNILDVCMTEKTLFAISSTRNFGDDLNKIIFEKIYGIKFRFSQRFYEIEYMAIGSTLEWFLLRESKIYRIKQIIEFKVLYNKIKTVVVLGTGFHHEPEKIQFLRKMDFKIVRGKLTEQVLLKHNLIRGGAVLGDLGLLAPYLLKENIEKRYKIGIIPHFNDLNSPIFYEIYKKMGKDAILISVKDSPDMVIKQIANCENIVSSSLHGLIVADSFGIPNLWIENKFKPQDKELHFKYLDYYSIFDICDIIPVQAIEFFRL
jgi:hypothetical protein